MKNILLINFRRIGDVLSVLPIASEYKNKGYNVDLLIYQECSNVIPILSIFSQIHTIDRNLIEVSMRSDLFSKAFPIDHLFEIASKLKNKKYEIVVNSSMDPFGAYFCSYLQEFGTIVRGVCFDRNSILRYSDLNCALFGEVNTVSDNNVNQLAFWNVSDYSAKTNIITDSTYSHDILTLFNDIKSKFGPNESSLKIIGVQLFASTVEKSLPENIIESLLEGIFDQSSLYPILLVSHSTHEIELAQRLNNRFNNQLIIIQCDLKALATVVNSVDVILAPDTMIVHLADNLSTPVIEIVNTSLNWMKQATRRNTNFIVGHRYLDKARNSFSKAILFGIGTILNIPAICDHIFLPEESLYKVASLNHHPIYIDCINASDFSFLRQAYIIHLINENSRSLANLLSKNIIDQESLTSTISNEREQLNELTKKIIAVIRLMKLRSNFNDLKMTETLSGIQQIANNMQFSSCIAIFLLNMLDRHAVEGEKAENILDTISSTRKLIKKTYQFLSTVEQSRKSSIEQNYKKSKIYKNDVLLSNLGAL